MRGRSEKGGNIRILYPLHIIANIRKTIAIIATLMATLRNNVENYIQRLTRRTTRRKERKITFWPQIQEIRLKVAWL
jgi:hypothetical protein